jgi:sulfate adenylyltransferase subunit 1 (EFTu-like GTPase family)
MGRLESGTIHQGDQVSIWPSGAKTRVNSIEFLWQKRTKAEAGESIGLTLPDLLSVKRGDIIAGHDYVPSVTRKLKANVFWMDSKPLTNREKIILRCATQEVLCQIENILERIDSSSLETIERDAQELKNSEVGKLIIKTELPIVVESFNDVPELGRFILERDLSTCGGGIIT